MPCSPSNKRYDGEGSQRQQPEQYERRRKKSAEKRVAQPKQVNHQQQSQPYANARQDADPAPGPGSKLFFETVAQALGHSKRVGGRENKAKIGFCAERKKFLVGQLLFSSAEAPFLLNVI